MNRVCLSYGSNRGDRKQIIRRALELTGEQSGRIVRCSSLYETAPWGFNDPVPFLNCVAELNTLLDPLPLLNLLLSVERSLGRSRPTNEPVPEDIRTFYSRSIDIDVLFFNDLVLNESGLIIPHPAIADRRFVLVPLAELDPCRVHPVSGQTVSRLLETCPDHSSVAFYGSF